MKSEKNSKISTSLKETKERRSSLVLKSYKIKIIDNKISVKNKEKLNSLFLEAKWIYNNYLSLSNNIYKINSKEDYIKINSSLSKYFEKVKIVQILNKDKIIESREIKYLSSQMKQSLIKDFQNSIKWLSASKAKWKKVWSLCFKSNYTSIELKQFWNTYKIINKNCISIQNLWKFKVSWLKQLENVKEFANAKLIKKASWYYLNITCYEEPDECENYKRSWEIWVDFWIKDQLILSNWVKFNFQIWESKRLKKLQRKYFKKVETHKRLGFIKNQKANKVKSKNWYKLQMKIKKEHEKIKNKRDNVRNKIVSYLKTFDEVVIQKENIKAWHSTWKKWFAKWWFSRKVQYSWIWGIIAKVKTLATHTEIDAFEATTKTCSCCWNVKSSIWLDERVYNCSECNYWEDRDINSAYNILQIWLNKNISPENRDIKERLVNLEDLLWSISLKQLVLA